MEQQVDIETVVLEGGSCVECSSPTITYVVKCQKCGYVETHRHTVSLTRGVTEVVTVQCDKCNHKQMVKIRYPR